MVKVTAGARVELSKAVAQPSKVELAMN